jgi:integrase
VTGLVYPKTGAAVAFRTREEIERRLADGDDEAGRIWDGLYLTIPEFEEVVALVRERAHPTFLPPMAATAAYTGMRRSELLRLEPRHVDLAAGVLTVTEKKRVRGRTTHRTVPISAGVARVLADWLAIRPALHGCDLQSMCGHAATG